MFENIIQFKRIYRLLHKRSFWFILPVFLRQKNKVLLFRDDFEWQFWQSFPPFSFDERLMMVTIEYWLSSAFMNHLIYNHILTFWGLLQSRKKCYLKLCNVLKFQEPTIPKSKAILAFKQRYVYRNTHTINQTCTMYD